MNYETDELTRQEQLAFSKLAKEQVPPIELEHRIVAQLVKDGLLHTNQQRWWSRSPQLLAGVATALIVFFVGATVGAVWNRQLREPAAAGYMLIVRTSNPALDAKTPEEESARVKEYSAWARDLGKRGKLLGGEKLKDEGRLLSGGVSTSVSEAPAKPGEGAVAGYFLLPALNYDEAVAIARTCPHLSHGGTVELRQIERF